MTAAAAKLLLFLPIHAPPRRDPRVLHTYSIAISCRRQGLHAVSCGCKYSNNRGRSKVQKTAEGARSLLRVSRRTRSVAEFDKEGYMRCAEEEGRHVPVMLGEVLRVFSRPGLRSFVDCTLGAAGHSVAIMRTHPELRLYIGLDVDPAALEMAKARINALLNDDSRYQATDLRACAHLKNFKYIKSILGEIDENLLIGGVDGILMDLGMSSMQVNNFDRGFSVLGDGPLDMRMNPQASLKAEDILNSWPEAEVGRILREYGEESNWFTLERKIVNARAAGGLHSTSELVDLVRKTSARSGGGRQGWIKTATRVFQALRIAVNDELKTLEDSLYASFDCLSAGGRLAVISFHSLEDRIVKRTFLDIIERGDKYGGHIMTGTKENKYKYGGGGGQRKVDDGNEEEQTCTNKSIVGRNGTILTKRPITPCEEEERLNSRCRSAKLRVIQKSSISSNGIVSQCLS